MRFTLLGAAIGAQRLWELGRSRAHLRRLAQLGARVPRERAFAAMALLHAGTLVAATIEWALRGKRSLARAPLVVLGAAQALRAWALFSLGEAWSVRVTRFDRGRPVVAGGPYRYIRHPNYLAVILELAALPLAGGAWLTALAATVVNAAVLAARIRFEERELFADPIYRAGFASLPRFIPWPRRS